MQCMPPSQRFLSTVHPFLPPCWLACSSHNGPARLSVNALSVTLRLQRAETPPGGLDFTFFMLRAESASVFDPIVATCGHAPVFGGEVRGGGVKCGPLAVDHAAACLWSRRCPPFFFDDGQPQPVPQLPRIFFSVS